MSKGEVKQKISEMKRLKGKLGNKIYTVSGTIKAAEARIHELQESLRGADRSDGYIAEVLEKTVDFNQTKLDQSISTMRQAEGRVQGKLERTVQRLAHYERELERIIEEERRAREAARRAAMQRLFG